MAAASYPMQAALRKDCILAVFPFNGGSVINPLRQTSAVYPNYNADSSGSYAVRNGLLEYNNIKITPEGFCAEDPTQNSGIITQLDFQKNNSSKTFICRAYTPKHNDGKLHILPYITQGNHTASATYQVFNFSIWENVSSINLKGIFVTGSHSAYGNNIILDDSFFNCWHVLAWVVDISDNAISSMYVDGQLINRKTITNETWNTLPESLSDNRAAIKNDTNILYSNDITVSWAMIFDSALSDDEIKAFG